MAQTNAGKKHVYVSQYQKTDGTIVPTHYRSTPSTSKGKEKSSKFEIVLRYLRRRKRLSQRYR